LINRVQILLGAVGLALGLTVYLLARQPEKVYFLCFTGLNLNCWNIGSNSLGLIGCNLPSFLHVFSFSLITASLMHPCRRTYIAICLAWSLIDLAFEFGQKTKPKLSEVLPDGFGEMPGLRGIEEYFLFGTFDYGDVAAIILGSILAYMMLLSTAQWRKVKWKKGKSFFVMFSVMHR
jgi:hypothetical protein